jgi:MoxR-vWA-beta-propeller ternary system domain bpX4
MAISAFHEFLTQLFDQGKIVFRAAPRDRPSPDGVAVLAEAFKAYRLAVAGPRIAFDPDIACAAAEFLRQAAWALVNHDDHVTNLVKRLKMPRSPLTPSHHLSADLTLRHVPQVLRRARGLDPSDPLVSQLANELRNWPLSAVLSDVGEGPRVSLEFGGHPGLMLLYAERLAGNDRPDWRPITNGPTWNYYELVLQERGQSTPAIDGNEVHGG